MTRQVADGGSILGTGQKSNGCSCFVANSAKMLMTLGVLAHKFVLLLAVPLACLSSE